MSVGTRRTRLAAAGAGVPVSPKGIRSRIGRPDWPMTGGGAGATPAASTPLAKASMSKRGSYWSGTGTHQAEFKRLRAALVTVGGTADTPQGELLRAVTHLYHDLKRYRFRHVAARWGDWRTVCAHRDRIAAAIGPNGTWVLAVVDRAITERYLTATGARPTPGETANTTDAEIGTELGTELGTDDDAPPRAAARFPLDAFETLVDGCVLAVRALDAA